MHLLRRLINILLLLCLANSIYICFSKLCFFPIWVIFILVVALVFWFIQFNIIPKQDNQPSRRLKILIGGYELFVVLSLCFALELLFYCLLLTKDITDIKFVGVITVNLMLALVIFFITAANAYFRVIAVSLQLRVVWRILLIFFWWVPLLNLYIFWKVCHIVKLEYQTEICKLELDEQRKENEICKTKYPIVLVHGIFFRDWQIVNYWSRIPKELIRNGADIYYGGQQSAAAVAQSGAELKATILKILNETGAKKVNIIAHSKGGLDARYAISKLGLAKYVASLTTIGTPHRGCLFVQFLIDKLPKGIIQFIAQRYNSLFQMLGDRKPDFLAGVLDLTPKQCEMLNQEIPNVDEVYYQSVVTVMKGAFSAPFPLNLSYLFIKYISKEPNDGLVTRFSALWGEVVEEPIGKGRRGISHGDVIDLFRENIPGYDVREFYVMLVSNLKEKGY